MNWVNREGVKRVLPRGKKFILRLLEKIKKLEKVCFFLIVLLNHEVFNATYTKMCHF